MAEVVTPLEVLAPKDDELRRLKAKQELDWLSQLSPQERTFGAGAGAESGRAESGGTGG